MNYQLIFTLLDCITFSGFMLIMRNTKQDFWMLYMWKHRGIWSGNLSSLQSLHSHIFKLPTQSSTKGCSQSYVCTGIPGIRCLQVSLIQENFSSRGKDFHSSCLQNKVTMDFDQKYERSVIPSLPSMSEFKGRLMLLLNTLH